MEDSDWRDEVLECTGVFNGGHSDYGKMNRLVVGNSPRFLYRYRSGADHDINALRDGVEYLSFPDGYNDPFDARMFYDHEEAYVPLANIYLNKVLDNNMKLLLQFFTGKSELDVYGERPDLQIKSLVKNMSLSISVDMREKLEHMSSEFKNVSNELRSNYEHKMRHKVLICSFSTSADNDLMWAHYAASHKGFCLEYELPSAAVLEYGFFIPVNYRESPVDVTGLVRKSCEDSKNIAPASMGSVVVKSKSWEYEDEWRYVRTTDLGNRYIRGMRLSKVLLGCNVSDDFMREVVGICKKRGVGVVKMERSRKSFDMEIGERLA